MKKDLHEIPRTKDSLSYIYIEHAKIRQDTHSIAFYDKEGVTPVPCASLNLLMLGPGTDITHAAVKNLVENDCMILWCGEEGVRFYAQGLGRTRSAKNITHQALLTSIKTFRVIVAKKMYLKRFDEIIPNDISIQQLRGKEGARVREIYRQNSKRTTVPWTGRIYKRNSWLDTDPINRAISSANSCLYGLCHASIVAMGYSPALGFIHTGKQLSFVYDIADLYKTEITIPLSFDIIEESTKDISGRVRRTCREKFRQSKLLTRIVSDIKELFDIDSYLNPTQRDILKSTRMQDLDYDSDDALPGFLWDPSEGFKKGGENYDNL